MSEQDEGPTPPSGQDLATWQAEIGALTSSRRLLDALLSPKDAKARIQSLEVEDLHRAIRVIGLADSAEILALAKGEQVRGMLDAEIWEKDDLSVERLDPWLNALMRSGPESLTRHMLALDDSILNWTVRRSVRAIVVEDPDSFDPPDLEHVVTPDNRLCVVFPDSAPRDLPVKVFLDVLTRTDPEFSYNLLIFSSAALDSVLQEEAYRWRSGRMADRGYVDYYDALPVYTPPRPDEITAARQALPKAEGPVGHWMRPVVAPDERLAAAVGAMDRDSQDVFHQGLAYVLNMALSADRIDPWDTEAAETVFQRVRCGLALGLEALAGDGEGAEGARQDARLLAEHTPTFIFRTGYGRVLRAVSPLPRLVRNGALRGEGGPTDAVDFEPLRAWAEALGARHPTMPDGRPLGSAADLAEASRRVKQLEALVKAASPWTPLDADAASPGLGARALTRLTGALLDTPNINHLPLSALADAHRALFSGGGLSAQAEALWAPWWARNTEGGDREAGEMLMRAAVEEMAALDPEQLEPRFLRLWCIAP